MNVPHSQKSYRSQQFGFLICLSVLFCFFTASLKAGDADYFMLQLGNEWTFDTVFTKPDGSLLKGTAHVKIIDKVQRGGHEYFLLQRNERGNSGYPEYNRDSTLLIRIDESGYYLREDDPRILEERKEMILPLKVGSILEKPYPKGTEKITVLDQGEVIVNGKHYEDCFHIKWETGDGSGEVWFAPKVGMVKDESKIGEEGSSTLILREFKMVKPEDK